MSGLDTLIESDFAALQDMRIGLVTHPAALSSNFQSAIEVFANSPHVTLAALFGPEHGLSGEAQDLIPVMAEGRVHSLYGDSFESLKPTKAMLQDLDALVIDMQDIGSRYYTYQATMLYCLEACAEIGLPVYVLDRPNPLGRTVEGPTIRPGFESFVGAHPIATRHGMTMGELAKLYQAERVPDAKLTVIACDGHVNWVLPPSPNMPTLDTARVYPGMCLIEGTNLSEGRGTTRPFEYIGFPGANGRAIADAMAGHPGIKCLPASFRPTFQKHAGQSCGGVFLVVTDVDAFQPVRFGLALLMAFRHNLGDRFQWRTETYEFVSHVPAIDLLFGSDRERTMIEAGANNYEIVANWRPEEAAFRERRAPYLLYS